MAIKGLTETPPSEARGPHQQLGVAVAAGIQNAVAVAGQLVPARDDDESVFAAVEVEASLLRSLRPLFEGAGLRLDAMARKGRFSGEHKCTGVYQETVLCAALLQLSSDALKGERAAIVGQFAILLKAFRGIPARFIAKGEAALTFEFVEALEDESDRAQDWRFVSWPDVENTIGGKRHPVLGVFKLELASFALKRLKNGSLESDDLQRIIGILAKEAQVVPGQVDGFFESLVKGSAWPPAWKLQRQGGWSGDARQNAENLVSYAREKGTFPAGHERAGISVLGWLLLDLVEKGTLGGVEQSTLAHVIIEHRLLEDNAIVEGLRKKLLP
jgi:hypothetical protein